MADDTSPQEPPTPPPTPEEVARYQADYANHSQGPGVTTRRAFARLWLTERGLLPADGGPPEPAPEADAKKRKRPHPAAHRQSSREIRGAFTPQGKRELVTRRMSEIEEQAVRWLWPGRIPLARLSFLLGRQGRGKSTLVSWLAATVANGLPWPDSPAPNPMGSVVILQAEEIAEEDMKYRYKAMGAVDHDIHVVDAVRCADGSEAMVSLARDVELLRELVVRIGNVRLIVIDPIGSYTHGINQRDDSEVRSVLHPLKALANDLGAAVLMVLHPSKNEEKDILDRAGNSGAFTQYPRVGWYYSDDPKDRSRRLLSVLKWNTRGMVKTGLAVSIRNDRLVWHPRPVRSDAFAIDRQLQKLDRDEKVFGKRGPDPTSTVEATEFLLGYLRKHGPCLQSAAQDQAQNVGIKESSFRKAMKHLLQADGRVRRERRESDNRWWLHLEEPAPGATGGTAEPASGEVPPPPPDVPDDGAHPFEGPGNRAPES